MLAMLLEQQGMGGQTWSRGFVTGFPLVGDVSYPGVYPAVEGVPAPVSTARLLTEAAGRWAELDRVVTREPQDVADL